ncbi:MAG: hypothetical protein QME88_07460 [Actinomycetota bacterium]|nr:hypothetical protein [Actinomycetota bacterium]
MDTSLLCFSYYTASIGGVHHVSEPRHHLARSLTRALGFSQEAFRLLTPAKEGKAGEVVQGLEGHLGKAGGEGRRKRISEAIAYISSLAAWLSDWRDVLPAAEDHRSPGAVEGNVDKCAADRFKKRGMSWRPRGAGHMRKIIELEGERRARQLYLKEEEGRREGGRGGHGLLAKGGEEEPGGLAQKEHAAARDKKR